MIDHCQLSMEIGFWCKNEEHPDKIEHEKSELQQEKPNGELGNEPVSALATGSWNNPWFGSAPCAKLARTEALEWRISRLDEKTSETQTRGIGH
jgi:hypothetical protein